MSVDRPKRTIPYDRAAERAEGQLLLERYRNAAERCKDLLPDTRGVVDTEKLSGRYRREGEAHSELFKNPAEAGDFVRGSRNVALGFYNINECANIGVGDMAGVSPASLEHITKMMTAPENLAEPVSENRAKVAEITRDAVATLETIGAELERAKKDHSYSGVRQIDQAIAGFLRRRLDSFVGALDRRKLAPSDQETIRMIHRAVTGILDTGVNPNNQQRATEGLRSYPAEFVAERIQTIENISKDLQTAILPDAFGRRMVKGKE